MNKIGVIIYSYKSKTIKNVLKNLIINQSGKNDVRVLLIDQHPLNRSENFKNEFGINYTHIFWDHQDSPIKRKYSKAKLVISDYLLFISDQVLMYEDWDEKLIQIIDNQNIILSGTGKNNIVSKNNFYFDIESENSNSLSLSNFIDRKFMFMQTKTFLELNIPYYLKYYGDQEHISLDCFTKNIKIYSLPTNFYFYTGINTIEELYTPYSLNHNYNEALLLLKNGKNKFLDISNRDISYKNFLEYHNINNINLLPFFDNDVLYDPNSLNFNKVDARRFIDRTRVID